MTGAHKQPDIIDYLLTVLLELMKSIMLRFGTHEYLDC